MTFIVKIPDIDNKGEYIEFKYKNAKEVAAALGIGENTVYAILNGRCAFNKPCTMKLKDCVIYKEKKYDNANFSEEIVDMIRKVDIEKQKAVEQKKEKMLKERHSKIEELSDNFIKNMKLVKNQS